MHNEKHTSLLGAFKKKVAVAGLAAGAALGGVAHADPVSDLHSNINSMNVIGEYNVGGKRGAVLKEDWKASPEHPEATFAHENLDHKKTSMGWFSGPDAGKAKQALMDFHSKYVNPSASSLAKADTIDLSSKFGQRKPEKRIEGKFMDPTGRAPVAGAPSQERKDLPESSKWIKPTGEAQKVGYNVAGAPNKQSSTQESSPRHDFSIEEMKQKMLERRKQDNANVSQEYRLTPQDNKDRASSVHDRLFADKNKPSKSETVQKLAEAVERINQHITKEKSFGVDQPEPRKTVMSPLSGKERAPVGQKNVMSPFSKSEDPFSSPETAKADARLARFKAHRTMKKPVLEEEGTDLDFSDQRPEMPKIPEKKPVVKEPVKKSMDVPTADAVNAPVAPAAPSVPTAEPMMKEAPQTPGQPAKKPKWKALHQGTWHNVLDTYNPDSNKTVHQGGGNVYVLEGKGVVPAHEIDDLEIKG